MLGTWIKEVRLKIDMERRRNQLNNKTEVQKEVRLEKDRARKINQLNDKAEVLKVC